MALEVKPFRPQNNVDIFNAIRKDASPEYQRRIPRATQGNVQDTIQGLLNYRPNMNEFIDSLVNRIGLEIYKSIVWTNPLAKFKRGMLNYGDTIEEINVGLLNAKRYDRDRDYLEKDIFGQERPDVQTRFHQVNRQDYYKISVNEPLLKRAFLSDYGLSTFITSLMTAPSTSDNWDEFLLTASLFNEYYRADGFFKVNVPDLGAVASDGADARFGLRRMREMAENLQFISTHYNSAGMPVAAQPDELELFITPEAQAGIDVEALAGAFNIDKAEFASRTTVIPKEHFNIPGAQAILSTREFFVIADQRLDTTNVVNPVGLHTNYFLHHWGVISASPFVPAVLFTTEPGTVINLDIFPVTDVEAQVYDLDGTVVSEVVRGEIYRLDGVAVTEGVNDAVRYELVGNISLRTYLSQTGVLVIDAGEDATGLEIRVIAVDTEFPQTLHTITIPVVGDKAVLWPNPHVDSDADTDGLYEVTPETPEEDGGIVTVPTQEGVSWSKAIVEGVTFTDAGDLVTVVEHGASVGDTVKFGTITSTTGITAGTTYYVKTVPSADTMTISATDGGATLALTTNGTSLSATFVAEDGSTHVIENETQFIAAARSGYEIAVDAETVFTYGA